MQQAPHVTQSSFAVIALTQVFAEDAFGTPSSVQKMPLALLVEGLDLQ
jgi:hypothetical protein